MYKVIVPTGVRKRIQKYGQYIIDHIGFQETAENLMERIFEAIYSLDNNPGRGAPRRVGRYANKGYRQLFVGNYIIVYRIDEANKRVYITTVRHMLENF